MIAEVVIASVTAITCGSLWLVDRIMQRESVEDDAGLAREGPDADGLRPWHDLSEPCALCGQSGREHKDREFVSRLKVLAVGGALLYTCGICGGTYRTRTKR